MCVYMFYAYADTQAKEEQTDPIPDNPGHVNDGNSKVVHTHICLRIPIHMYTQAKDEAEPVTVKAAHTDDDYNKENALSGELENTTNDAVAVKSHKKDTNKSDIPAVHDPAKTNDDHNAASKAAGMPRKSLKDQLRGAGKNDRNVGQSDQNAGQVERHEQDDESEGSASSNAKQHIDERKDGYKQPSHTSQAETSRSAGESPQSESRRNISQDRRDDVPQSVNEAASGKGNENENSQQLVGLGESRKGGRS